MKRITVPVTLLALSILLAVSCGCGASKTKEDKGTVTDSTQTKDHQNDEVTQTDYDLGLAEGHEDGYDQGYADGKQGSYNPEPVIGPAHNEDYAAGYGEGFLEGYKSGYNDAQGGTGEGDKDKGGDELAEVEAAMLAFVKANAVPGMEFKIENIVIHGDEAAGIAVCTSERLESPLIIMKKGTGGWSGVDFGTGIEPPSWYSY